MSIYLNRIPTEQKVKTVVFDLDGVIVDVRASFRKMIVLSVNHYFRFKLGLRGRKYLIDSRMIEAFKSAGGFNNDWELAASLVLFYLSRYFKTGKPQTFNTLRADISEIIEFIRSAPSNGISGFKSLIEGESKVSESVFMNYDEKLVFDICKALYAGNKVEEMYGSTDISDKSFLLRLKKHELYRNEKPLLDETLLSDEFFYGIITGRTPGEIIPLRDIFPKLFKLSKVVIADDGNSPRKPDPETLKPFISENWLPLVYIGDSRDDFELVKNSREAYKTDKIYFVAIAETPEKIDFYKKLGSDIVASDVNNALKILNKQER